MTRTEPKITIESAFIGDDTTTAEQLTLVRSKNSGEVRIQRIEHEGSWLFTITPKIAPDGDLSDAADIIAAAFDHLNELIQPLQQQATLGSFLYLYLDMQHSDFHMDRSARAVQRFIGNRYGQEAPEWIALLRWIYYPVGSQITAEKIQRLLLKDEGPDRTMVVGENQSATELFLAEAKAMRKVVGSMQVMPELAAALPA